MGWQIFLTISILCESFGRVLMRSLVRNSEADPSIYAIWSQFISGILLLTFAIISGFKIPSNINQLLPNLILMPFLYGGMNLLIFKALEKTEASIFTILFGARVIIIVLLSVLFLKETFVLKQLLGTMFIILSIVLVSFKRERIQFKKGELFSLLAGVFLAGGVINDSFILRSFDPKSYSALGFLLPGFVMLAINFKQTQKIVTFPKYKKLFLRVILLSFIFGGAYLSYNTAYFSGHNAAQIASIFQITSVLTVILAIILLKEKSRLLIKILAALIGFVGVSLVG